VRHLGPTAQDFHAAFHLGESERTIATVDADGVALAAIQGLNEKVEAGSERAEVRTRQLGQRLEQTATEITELKQRLAALERIVLNLSTKGN
jgi:DNA-binding transcriptional MerR regulator